MKGTLDPGTSKALFDLEPTILSIASASVVRQARALLSSGKLLQLSGEGAVLRGLFKGRKRSRTRATLTCNLKEETFYVKCTSPPCRKVCRHVVAALLGFCEQRSSSTLRPGMPREKLVRWADEHETNDWLGLRYGEVLPIDYRAWELSYTSLLDVVCAPYQGGSELRHQKKAISFLEQRADDQRRAREEERTALEQRKKPSNPRLRKIFEELSTLRESMREEVVPVLRSQRGACRLELTEDPPGLRYEETRKAHCGGAFCTPKLQISFPEDGQTVCLECNCPTPRPEGCSFKLHAIDDSLDLLGLKKQAGQAKKLAAALAVPAWQRVLRALERSVGLADGSVEAPEGELAWQVDTALSRLDPAHARPKKNGKGSVTRRLRWSEARALCQHPADQRLFDLQRASRVGQRIEDLPGALVAQGLWELLGHPRVFVKQGKAVRLRVERVEPALGLREDVGGARAVFQLAEQTFDAEAAAALLEERVQHGMFAQLDLDARRVQLARIPDSLQQAVQLLARRGSRFPAEAIPELLRSLPQLSRHVPLAVGTGLRGREIEDESRPVLQLELDADSVLHVALRMRVLPEWAPQVPGAGPPQLYAQRDEGTVHAARDLAAECARTWALAQTLGLHAVDQSGDFCWELREREAALTLVAEAQRRSEATEEGEDLLVAWGKRRWQTSRAAQLGDISMSARARDHWFRLEGTLEVDGSHIPLSELLAAVRERRRFIEVDGERWVQLGETLRERLAATAQLAEGARGRVEVSRFAVPVVEELAEAGVRLSTPEAWTSLLTRLEAAHEFEPELPQGLQAELYPYQLQGYRWLARLAHWGAGACLADDMGLGKTVQALTLLLQRQQTGAALVVAPTSVLFNWEREAQRFTPTLRAMIFRGKRDLQMLQAVEPGQLLITSYDLVARYATELRALQFGTLVLDEAQAIKNAATRRARAVFQLQAEMRLALTGTPIENRTGELWSLFHAIAPGLLGSQERFRQRFALPIEQHQDVATRALLARVVRPFILRRLKSEVALELPERTDVRVDVELSRTERELYESFRSAVLTELEMPGEADAHKQRFRILAALTRLRQIACDARLVRPDVELMPSKLQTLRELLASLREEGHRALVFSQFTSFLKTVRATLEADGFACRYLDGSLPQSRRRAEIDAFQAGEGDVFLLSLHAGGRGLNLTAADYVVHTDPWWNPAVEDQATDRAHRLGQTRPVTVYRLVARDTVEEKILALHEQKRELISALLDGSGTAAALSSEQLLALIRQSGQAADGDGSDPALLATEALREEPAAAEQPQPVARRVECALETIQGRLEAVLAQAVERREVGAATMRNYLRIAERLIEYFRTHDFRFDPLGIETGTAAYRRAVRVGDWQAPRSDAQRSGALRGWLLKAAAMTGAEKKVLRVP